MEATPGGDWNVMWEFQHLIPPDACGLGPAFASPVVTFPRNATGVVISTGGSIQHTAHLDTWQFQFVRDIANPANNRIYLNVWHPEPTTLALLAVGSLVLFRRR
jgi:hypothetical protein